MFNYRYTLDNFKVEVKPVDQKKYLKEHPSSKFGQKKAGPVKSLNKHKDEITNVRQANAKMKEIKEQLDKVTKARPRTEEGKKAKALAIKKLTKLHDGIKQHKENMSKPAGKTGAKGQPAPKPKYWWGSSPYKQVKLKDLTDRYGTGFENNVKEMTVGGENLGLRLTPEAQKGNYLKSRAFLEQTGFKLGPEDLKDLTAAARGSVQGFEGFAERLAARKKVQTNPNFAQDFARTLLGVKKQTEEDDDEESLFLRDPSKIKLAPKAAPKGSRPATKLKGTSRR